VTELKPLKITCTSSDCSNNLHCFLKVGKLKNNTTGGQCRTCGAELIDWVRVYRCDPSDMEHTFRSLKLELIRHHFWHIPMTDRLTNYALKKGRPILRQAAENQIRRSIGSAAPFRDGYQTPREDSLKANPIHYAQHATASCCRKCLEEWHGIPQCRELTGDEISYLTSLVMLYLEERVQQLTDFPQRLRARRKRPPLPQPGQEMGSQPGYAA